MDAVVSAIITPVVDLFMVHVKKHMGFLISSPKYVKDMDAKMKQLEGTARKVQNERDMALANTEVVPELAEPWLKDVENVNEKAKSIPTGAIGCFNVSKRYKAGKHSFDMLKEIEDLVTREFNIKFTREKISLAQVRSTFERPTTSAPVNTLASRDVLFNDALKSLQSNDETKKMIALCGTGGVGKSTLMEQLKKVVESSAMFDWVIKVVVGENNDPIALQRDIAEYIREDLSETTKHARAERLRKIFEGMSQQGQKKILVIMDDIWKEVDLQDVGLTSPLPNGYKMLFTSRDKNLCYHMGVKTDSIIDVGVLDFDEAKTLFFGIVGPSILDHDDPDYRNIGEDIVKNCGGLPIVLKTIAVSLRYRIKEEWKEALFKLQHDHHEGRKDVVHKVFEISYNYLQREDDKAIFLLSGLFPDDFDIRIEDLTRYGWGLKLFTNVHTLAEARMRTNICVDNLTRANLLTESETTGCVKMHDLIRAFVLSNFTKVKQASIVNYDDMSRNRSKEDAQVSYERILLKCTGLTKFPVDFNHPNLSVLMLMEGHDLLKFPEDIYERMGKLEVVSYENMHIPMLPVTFQHYSPTLRTLCLRSCSFKYDDLSLLGSLSNLETLSIIDCGIRRLPSAIGKLKRLKLLDLTGCVHLRVDDGVFQNLDGLEELYMRGHVDSPFKTNESFRFTKANCDELETLSYRLRALELEFFENKVKPRNMSFKNLQRFRISIGCKLAELRGGEKHLFRNTIQFVGDCIELLECKINEIFGKTEELRLQVNEMNNLEDVVMHHSFSNLTVLHVSKCADLTCLLTFDVAIGLKKLERLTISECPVMTTLVAENTRVGVIRFQKLNFLYLDCLPEMVSFGDHDIEFPEMVELKLNGLPNFTSIYPHSPNSSGMQSLFNKKVVIPRLEKLEIAWMENLKYIWSCETTDAYMLREISVRGCNNLTNLFPNNPLPLLNRLEELYVASCGSIEVLFNMEFESFCGTGENIYSKLRSIRVFNLEKLKDLWRMKGVNKCDVHINYFKDVETIEINNCSVFENIFTPTTVTFDLGALTNYITQDIGEKINAIVNEEISEMDESTPNATYPLYFLHTSHHLKFLELDNDKRVEEVLFEMDSHQPPLLPYLELLALTDMKEMSHVWKCNWSKFIILHHPPLQFSFQNLTYVFLEYCPKITYLFSPLMVDYLSNLKLVGISWCDGIEEVISSRDDRNKETTSASSQDQHSTFFPQLDILQLRELSCLKSIDNRSQSGQVNGARWSLCQYPAKIDIRMCHALSSLIPWYATGQMKRLQELKIVECERMVEVFESESGTINVDEGSAHAGAGTTLTTPTLKYSPTVAAPQLSNLKRVKIYKCDLLSHVFTFSTLESLKQLKELRVRECKAIKEIVKEENGTSSKDVVFPRLESVELEDLPNLKGFYLGMNDFRWPLLDKVIIINCPQLLMFTSGQSKTSKLKYIHTELGKHSGTINEYQTTFPNSPSSSHPLWSFHNLIKINLKRAVGTTIIPSTVLLQLKKLEKIHLNGCNVKKVFEVVASEGNESQTILKIPIPNLTKVKLYRVWDLKYLWKSNQHMVIEFPNLKTLSINYGPRLEHVFTCSMVGSLVQLQDLHIRDCHNIEVIVKEEEEECDAKVNEIMHLPHLKSIKLIGLQSLKGFCLGKKAFSLPALDTLQIVQCSAISVFTKGHVSTPELKVIDTSFGKYDVKRDLNSFIKIQQEEGYEF